VRESTTIVTLIKMVESLPEPAQNKVIEHLREYIIELQDEDRWDQMVEKTQPKLVEAAQHAKRKIANG
jgi:hypothetical protein